VAERISLETRVWTYGFDSGLGRIYKYCPKSPSIWCCFSNKKPENCWRNLLQVRR